MRDNESPHDRVADEEIVLYHVMKRDRTPVRDRLTPRMEARRLIDALDAGRDMRQRTAPLPDEAPLLEVLRRIGEMAGAKANGGDARAMGKLARDTLNAR